MEPVDHPLLEVLDTGPVLEGRVAQDRQPSRDLVGEVALERQQRRRVGPAEVELVQVEQPPQLGHRPLVVVDAQVDLDVGLAAVAAAASGHEQRRALPAAPVATGVVARGQGRRAGASGRGAPSAVSQARLHRLDDLRARRGCCPAPRSRRRCGRRPTAWQAAPVYVAAPPCRVDDAGLALVAAVVGGHQRVQGLLRRAAGAQHREAVGPVGEVGVRLRRDRPDVGLRRPGRPPRRRGTSRPRRRRRTRRPASVRRLRTS